MGGEALAALTSEGDTGGGAALLGLLRRAVTRGRSTATMAQRTPGHLALSHTALGRPVRTAWAQ